MYGSTVRMLHIADVRCWISEVRCVVTSSALLRSDCSSCCCCSLQLRVSLQTKKVREASEETIVPKKGKSPLRHKASALIDTKNFTTTKIVPKKKIVGALISSRDPPTYPRNPVNYHVRKKSSFYCSSFAVHAACTPNLKKKHVQYELLRQKNNFVKYLYITQVSSILRERWVTPSVKASHRKPAPSIYEESYYCTWRHANSVPSRRPPRRA